MALKYETGDTSAPAFISSSCIAGRRRSGYVSGSQPHSTKCDDDGVLLLALGPDRCEHLGISGGRSILDLGHTALLFNFFFLPPVGVNHRGPVSTRFDFNLEQLTHSSGSASVLLATGKNIRHRLRPVVISFGVLLFAGAMFLAGRLTKVGARPIFHQLTFQRRRVLGARFSPDGQTILYSAEWNGDSSDVYSTRADRPGARSRGMPGGEVLAVSSAGDVAILSKITVSLNFADTGTLALASTPFAHVRECQRLPGTLSVDSRFS